MAATEGKNIDVLAEEAIRKGLEERAWQDLIDYGRETGSRSGYTEADVPELIRACRREQRTR